MNAHLVQITVMKMLIALIPMAALLVLVSLATLVMELLVQVQCHVFI